MPDIMFDTLEAIPEGLREFAKRRDEDGKFSVNVVPKVKLDEFRETNIKISQERDAAARFVESVRPFVGEDPAAFASRIAELEKIAQRVKDGQLKGSDDVEAELSRRVAQMKTEFENANKRHAQESAEWRNRAQDAELRYRRSLIDRAVTDAVLSDKSAEPRALADILTRAYSIFQVGDDGRIVAKEGEAIVYGSDGATPMSPAEWLTKLKEQAPYFFKSSSGGGANGGGQNAGASGLPPGMTREQYDKLPAAEKLKWARKLK